MYSFKTLEIAGHGNRKVPNTFFRQQESASRLVVVLPGIGYTCQMPLLYYPTRVAIELGMDVLWLEYDYIRDADYQALPEAKKEYRLFCDTEAALRVAQSQRPYNLVILIGKSMGTRAISHLVTLDSGILGGIAWITPVLTDLNVRAQIKGRKNDLIVLGTADHYFDQPYVAELMAAKNNELLLVDGADHSMEIQGNTLRSVQIMEEITGIVRSFLLRFGNP
jgi:predicted alpha/beta-hydrolase family hydrolase